MRIGVPREAKDNEYRVALTPSGVRELVRHGHDVRVEEGAGAGSAMPDEEYKLAGAQLVASAASVWGEAELVLKVKEPIPTEYEHLRDDLVLFTYLHLAASRECTAALLEAGTTAVAYETVTRGERLPLLAPMSEVAGRLAPQVGAAHLMRSGGGRGLLLGGVPGARAGHVVIIGAGVSGRAALAVAVGMQARVTVLDTDLDKLRAVDELYGGRVQTLFSTIQAIENAVVDADLVVGAVLVPGARAPRLVPTELVARMRSGAVLVDVAVDQGGCFADTRPTTHAHPVYPVHDTIFYCVANMPGAVPNTSTHALANATLPFTLALADHGWRAAMRADAGLARGLATHDGALVSDAVASAHDLTHTPIDAVLAA